MLHTDAIWRACRIILDVRMHRGELTVDEATDFLVEQTGFERPNARSEVAVVHVPPDLPPVVPARTLAAPRAARRRAAPARRRVLAAGVPRHAAAQRVAADQLPPPAAGRRGGLSPRARHPVHRPRRRPLPHRLLAGRVDRGRGPDRPAGADRRAVRGAGAQPRPPRRLRGGARPGRRRRSMRSGRSPRARRSRSSSPAGSIRPRASSWRSRPARPGSC